MTIRTRQLSDWKFVPLGQLLKTVQSGFASGKRDPNGVIQMRMNNVTTDGNLDWTSFIRVPASEKQFDKYRLYPGDVLFNATNSPNLVGKTAMFRGYTEPVVFSNHFVRLRVDKSKLDPSYLAHWLTHQQQRKVFENICTQWVNQASVRKDDLLSLRIPLPPLPEQKRIAAILAKADRLRRLRHTARDLSDTYLQSVFLEMFGDPIQNLRSWPKRMLKRLGKVVTGTTPPSSGENMFGGLIPFITPGDLEVDTLKTQRFVTEQGAEKSRTVRAGSTMVCCIGATIGKMDKARTLSAFNQQINAIEWNNEVDDDFGLIAMKFYAGVIVARGRSTTLPILKKSEFEKISIPVPPLALQQRFAHIVHKFERLRAQQREAQRQAEHLFQTLLHRAFRGEL